VSNDMKIDMPYPQVISQFKTRSAHFYLRSNVKVIHLYGL